MLDLTVDCVFVNYNLTKNPENCQYWSNSGFIFHLKSKFYADYQQVTNIKGGLSNEAKADLIRIHHYGVQQFGMAQTDKCYDTLFE